MRTFLALDLSPAVRSALAAVPPEVCRLEPSWCDARWIDSGNLHVTLKFLGELTDERVDAVVESLALALGPVSPFSIRFGRIRAVPSSKRASMLWAAFEDSPERGALAALESAEAALEPFGIHAEERVFRPHVTLTRCRRPKRIAADTLDKCSALASHLLTQDEREMSVLGATLYQSTLTPEGAVYEDLAWLPFENQGTGPAEGD